MTNLKEAYTKAYEALAYKYLTESNVIIRFVGNLSVELLKTETSLTELFGDEDVIIEKVLRFDTIFDVKLWLGQILQYISDYMREKSRKTCSFWQKKQCGT